MSTRHAVLVSLRIALAALPLLELASAQVPPVQTGWPVQVGAPILASPRAVDLDGDGTQELLLGTYGPPPNSYTSGTLHVWSHDGSVFSPNWPLATSGPVAGTPAVGDMDGDGVLEIVLAHWGGLNILHPDGNSLAGWPMPIASYRAPALGDLDGDGDLEAVFVTGTDIQVFHHDGTPYGLGWPQGLSRDTTEVLLLDIDGDGRPEVFAGDWNNNLVGWSPDGAPLAGWTKTLAGAVRVGPVAGDVDGDGSPEIVQVTWNPDELHVFDASGNTLPGWPVSLAYARLSTPTLVDIDHDGDLEIFIGGWQHVFGLDHRGAPLPGWPVAVPTLGSGSGNINSNAIAADLDGDDVVDLLWKITDGFLGLHTDGSPVPGFPIFLDDQSHSGTFSPTPAVADLDHDGDVELVGPATFDAVAVWDLAPTWSLARAPWDSFRAGPLAVGGYGRGRTLVAQRSVLSTTAGGSAAMKLDLAPGFSGAIYLLLASFAGTSPGIPLGSAYLPLYPDFLTFQFAGVASPPFTGFVGTLDAEGAAYPSLDLGIPGPGAVVAGYEVTMAAVILQGAAIAHATNAVSVALAP